MSDQNLKFKGVKACGCVQVLYNAEYDTPKQRQKALKDIMKQGCKIEPIKDDDQARKEWAEGSKCNHPSPPKSKEEIETETNRLLGVS